jgi:hypothetical protein
MKRMSDKTRMVAIIAVLVVVGAVLWNLQFLSFPEKEDRQEVASPPIPEKTANTSAPKPATRQTESPAVSEKPTIEEEAAPAEFADKSSKRGGRGKLLGAIEMSDGQPIPSDLILTLHYIPDEARYDGDFETVYATLEINGKKEYEFTNLPFGNFTVFGTSATHSGTFNRTLSAQNREYTTGLSLYPGTFISGTVVNTKGEAVTDGHVFVTGWETGGRDTKANLYRSRSSEVATDETGAFYMNNLQQRTPKYRLVALAPGYAPSVTELLPVGTTGVQIVMAAGGSVSGHVENQDLNEPVAGISVVFGTEYVLTGQEQKTDEDGAFQFENLAAGSYRAAVDDDALVVTPGTRDVDLNPGQILEGVIVQIRTGGSVAGRIYDSETEAGIAGATIQAYPNDRTVAESKTATSDASGRYVIEGLLDAAYRVDYSSVKGYPQNRRFQDRKEIVASLGQQMDNIDFVLSRGLRIGGRVVDQDGNPVEKASVRGENDQRSFYESTTTDGNGRFELYGISDGLKVEFVARAKGFAYNKMSTTYDAASPADLEIVLTPEAKISGTIVDEFGAPAGSISVYAVVGRDWDRRDSNTTNAAGEFIFDGLAPDQYDIKHQPRSGYLSFEDPLIKTVTLEIGEHIQGLRLVLPTQVDSGIAIFGRVTDDIGNPISAVNVRAYGRNGGGSMRGVTDDNGQYRLTNAKNGMYQLNFDKDKYTQGYINEIEVGSDPIDFVLQREGSVSGRIVGPNQLPITDFSVALVNGGYNFNRVRDLKRFRHDEGRFTVDGGRTDRELSVLARAQGYADTLVPVGKLLPGELRQDVLVQMQVENIVNGLVVDSDGNPVSGAGIYRGQVPRNDYERENSKAATSNREGRFELKGMPAGTNLISATKPGLSPDQVIMQITERNTDVTLTLAKGASLEGYVTMNGSPLANAHVYASIQTSGPEARVHVDKQGNTDDKGYFRFSGLPEGTGSLSVSTPSSQGLRRNMSKQFETANGMSTQVDFDFVPASSAIEGYIFLGENEPGPGRVNVSITKDGVSESQYKDVDSTGYFLLEPLPAGTYSLRLYNTDGHRGSTKTGELGENETLRIDFNMYGLTDIVCTVHYPNADEVMVGTINGTRTVEGEMSLVDASEILREIQNRKSVRDGAVTISQMENGTYTVVMMAVKTNGTERTVDFRSKTIVVNDQGEMALEFSF